jgi:hypothetical protein
MSDNAPVADTEDPLSNPLLRGAMGLLARVYIYPDPDSGVEELHVDSHGHLFTVNLNMLRLAIELTKIA